MSIIEHALFALRNTHGDCKRCGQVHPFLTRDEKVLLVTADQVQKGFVPVSASTDDVLDEVGRAGLTVGWRT